MYECVVDPLLTAIRRELGAIVARLHRIDFGKSVDRAGGMGGPSFYMKDLVDKLSFIKTEVLSKYSVEGESHTWYDRTIPLSLFTRVLSRLQGYVDRQICTANICSSCIDHAASQ